MFKSNDYKYAPLVLQRFNNELDKWEDISGFGKFDSVIDLYHYIGILANRSNYSTTITMLAFYSGWDTIKTYKEYIIKECNSVCCEFHDKEYEYRIMYQEV